MSNAWGTSARGKRASHGAYHLWFMRSTVEKEQLAPRPDVSRWSVSLSIRERAKERRRTSVAAPSAPNWCPCAFIIRSSAVSLCAMFRSVGSWSASCKLFLSIKPNSWAFKGEISLVQSLNDYWRFRFSLKPVPQFVIPPITTTPTSSSITRSESSSSSLEPAPKRLRLSDESSSSDHEAQQHSIKINNVINALVNDQLRNAQPPRTAEVM